MQLIIHVKIERRGKKNTNTSVQKYKLYGYITDANQKSQEGKMQ